MRKPSKTWAERMASCRPHEVKPAPMDIAGMKAGEIVPVYIQRGGGGNNEYVVLKAVEPSYPLYGVVELQGGSALTDALAKRDGVWGAVVEDAALQRMNASIGDKLKVGDAIVDIRAVIAREPDRGVNAFASLGPRLMIPMGAVAARNRWLRSSLPSP